MHAEGPRWNPPRPFCRAVRSVAGVLRATAVGRATAVHGTAGAGELPRRLAGRQPAALGLLLELHRGRLLDRAEEPADGPAGSADLVHPLGHRSPAVGQLGVTVLVHRAEGLVHLDELAAGQATDDTGLDPVLQHLAVVLLETEADAVREHVDDRRDDDDADAPDPGHRVQADGELVGD